MIIERPRRRGYQLHPPDSPEAEALLIERGLTRADLDHAIAELERTEGIQIRTIAASTTTACSTAGRLARGPAMPGGRARRRLSSPLYQPKGAGSRASSR